MSSRLSFNNRAPALFFLVLLCTVAYPCDFTQKIEIDTNKRLLQIIPDYTTQTALEAHRDIEKGLKRCENCILLYPILNWYHRGKE